MSIRNGWSSDYVQEVMPRNATAWLYNAGQKSLRRQNNRDRYISEISRMRHTLISKAVAAVKAGRLRGTTESEVRHEISEWSDGKIHHVYETTCKACVHKSKGGRK